jgi:hypothetical protein
LLSSKAIITIPLLVAFLPLTPNRFFLPLPLTLLPLNIPLLPHPLDLCIGSTFRRQHTWHCHFVFYFNFTHLFYVN